jgi:hypothetical protein
MKQKMLVTIVDVHYHIEDFCVAVGFCGARTLPSGEIVPVVIAFPLSSN